MTAMDAPATAAPKLDAPKIQQQPQDGSTKAANEVYDILRSARQMSGLVQSTDLKDFGSLHIDDGKPAAEKADKDGLTKFAIQEESNEMKISSHTHHERTNSRENAQESEQSKEKHQAKEQGQRPGDHHAKPQDQNSFQQLINRIEQAPAEIQINLLKTAATTLIQEFQKADNQYSREADQHFWKGFQPCLNSVYTSVAMIDATLHGKGGKVLPIYLQQREKQIDQLKQELEQVMKKGPINCGAETMIKIMKSIQEIFTEPGNKLANHAAELVAPTAFGIGASGIKSEIIHGLPDSVREPYEAINHGKEQLTKPGEWGETLGKLAHGERKGHHATRNRAGSRELKCEMSNEIASSGVQDMLDNFELFDDDSSELKKHAA